MEKSQLTFHFKGPWFTDMNFIATVDPANVNHVFSKSFANYVKGPKFYEIFEALGDGIFNTDSTLWQYHRRLAHSFFSHPKFHTMLVNNTREEIESRLIPLLDHVSTHDIEIDLQDLFKSFTYDIICVTLMGYDPKFLSLDLPHIPLARAITELGKEVFFRHMVPTFVWKFPRWLDVGQAKYKKACETIDDFICKCIAEKRAERSRGGLGKPREDNDYDFEVNYADLLTLYMDEVENSTSTAPINHKNGDKFFRDAFLNFFLGGGDTPGIGISWLFYVLVNNTQVTEKIREELKTINNIVYYDVLLKNKLVYLHATICEALRLYPPLAFNHKTSIKSDILPSGHLVGPNVQIFFDMYSMGRIKSIWGDDCYEFKPERWISKRGNINFEPSYKFLSFGSGPRMCQGKDMVFTQMTMVVAAIIQNYDIEAVHGHQVVPDVSVNLQMKHGFKVKVKRRLDV